MMSSSLWGAAFFVIIYRIISFLTAVVLAKYFPFLLYNRSTKGGGQYLCSLCGSVPDKHYTHESVYSLAGGALDRKNPASEQALLWASAWNGCPFVGNCATLLYLPLSAISNAGVGFVHTDHSVDDTWCLWIPERRSIPEAAILRILCSLFAWRDVFCFGEGQKPRGWNRRDPTDGIRCPFVCMGSRGASKSQAAVCKCI